MNRTGSITALVAILLLALASVTMACGGKAKAPAASAPSQASVAYRGEAGAALSEAASAAGRAGDVLATPDLASAAWRTKAVTALDEVIAPRGRAQRLTPPGELQAVHTQVLAALEDIAVGASALRTAIERQEPAQLVEAVERLPNAAASLAAARAALGS